MQALKNLDIVCTSKLLHSGYSWRYLGSSRNWTRSMAHMDIQNCNDWFQRIKFFSLVAPSSLPQFCGAFSHCSWSTQYWFHSTSAIAGHWPQASSSRYAWSRNSQWLCCQPQPQPCPSGHAISFFCIDKWSIWTGIQNNCSKQMKKHLSTRLHLHFEFHKWCSADNKLRLGTEVSPRCQIWERSLGILSCISHT